MSLGLGLGGRGGGGLGLGSGGSGGASGYWLAAISDDTPTPDNELPVLVDTAATGALATLVTNLPGTIAFGVDAAFSSSFSVNSSTGVITFIIGAVEGQNDPVLFTADNGTFLLAQNVIFEGVGAAPASDSGAAYLMELGFI